MSRVYAASGRMQAAMALTGKATARDPKSVAWVVRAYHLLGVGRIDEARATAQHALLQRPQDEHAYYYLGLCDPVSYTHLDVYKRQLLGHKGLTAIMANKGRPGRQAQAARRGPQGPTARIPPMSMPAMSLL